MVGAHPLDFQHTNVRKTRQKVSPSVVLQYALRNSIAMPYTSILDKLTHRHTSYPNSQPTKFKQNSLARAHYRLTT